MGAAARLRVGCKRVRSPLWAGTWRCCSGRGSVTARGTCTCSCAASGGHLAVLQWARAHGCEFHEEYTRSLAAEGGHAEMLTEVAGRTRRVTLAFLTSADLSSSVPSTRLATCTIARQRPKRNMMTTDDLSLLLHR